MNLRQYLIVLALGTAVSLSSWCLVLIAINPLTAGAIGLIAFYGTLALSLLGLFTIIGTSVRARRLPEGDLGGAVSRSLRQAIFLTILMVGSLYLLTAGLFSILSLLIAVAALGFLEFFFLAFRRDSAG